MTVEFQILILLSSVLIGGLLVELIKNNNALKLLLSFSGGYLLTIIFTHILPETYEHFGSKTGYFILAGFLLQLVLEYFSQGAEHGHTHASKVNQSFPIVVFVSLSIHSFVEAIPIINAHAGHSHIDNNLLWGIFLHKVPVAIALLTIFKSSKIKPVWSWVGLGTFAITAPLGLLTGSFLTSNYDINTDWILAIAIGMFLHISTTIIFESNEGHKLNLMKLFAILVGFGLGILVN